MKHYTMLPAILIFCGMLAAAPQEAEAQKLLKNVKVTGDVVNEFGDVVGAFDGKLTIDGLAFDPVEGLLATGVLKGKVSDGEATENINTDFTTVLDLLEGGEPGVCDILNLDLGPINLDLLGLVVDVSPISIDITAESGQGNLLGNLLCAVAGLRDADSPLLDVLNSILNAINQLLG